MPGRLARSPLCLAAACAFFLAPAARVAAQEQLTPAEQAELRRLEAEVARERQQSRELEGQEIGLLSRLADLERDAEIEQRSLRAAQVHLRAANRRLASAEKVERDAQDEIARASQRLAPRLLSRYRLGREGFVRFLLGSRSLTELLRRKRLFDALLAADFAALQELKARREAALAAQAEVAKARDQVAASVASEQERRRALEAKVDAQRRLLTSVQHERGVHEVALRELTDAAQKLSTTLARLSKHSARTPEPHQKPPAASKPSRDVVVLSPIHVEAQPPVRAQRGHLLFPVDGGRIEVRFGRAKDPLLHVISVQRGIDVRAEPGTPVRAVYGGKVVHAGWFRGYGNLIILDHGDGIFSLMAHLATLERAVGDAVKRGDEVGTLGDSGSLKGPYLYFELREGQTPLDPERWLSPPRHAPPAR